MQKQNPMTENSQKGKKSWGGPGPGSGQDLTSILGSEDGRVGSHAKSKEKYIGLVGGAVVIVILIVIVIVP